MIPRVPVEPALLLWACDRRGLPPEHLAGRFPKLPDWLGGTAKPTLTQLEAFAAATYTPVGYLFLRTPPVESVPIPDMRTMGSRRPGRPTPDLLDTIYLCQQRQDWYRDFARASGEPPLDFVGSARTTDDPEQVAGVMRTALGFDVEGRQEARTWEEALRVFVEQAEATGVLVMISGIVGANSHRALDPEEFRGFALCDRVAPVVFINGADTRAAQMFTLAHELAHVWLGESALTDSGAGVLPDAGVERWCNRAAAELLVPLARLRVELRADAALDAEIARLARVFKVSTLVIIRRLHDLGQLDRQEMWQLYEAELARLRTLSRSRGGGDFYRTQRARVGRRFARAVFTSTWEGRSSFTEAFRLLGVRKMATFKNLGTAVGLGA